ncbi:MAG: hypothetical protein JSV09_10800, partial [Thermoplasmata archaeon]
MIKLWLEVISNQRPYCSFVAEHPEKMKAAELIKPYFIENRVRILIGLLCLITVDILQLFIPRIIKRAVDNLTGFQIDVRQL